MFLLTLINIGNYYAKKKIFIRYTGMKISEAANSEGMDLMRSAPLCGKTQGSRGDATINFAAVDEDD